MANFCPQCDGTYDCGHPLHDAFTKEDVWDYAQQGGILHGTEFEDDDSYK